MENNLYQSKQRLKIIFVIVAMLIAIASIYFTNRLANALALEEQKKIEIWAEATQLLSITDIEDNAVNDLVFKVIVGNENIPVIFDYQGMISSRNVKPAPPGQEEEYYAKLIKRFSEKHPPIVLNLLDDELLVYYDDSFLLKQLYYSPYILLTVVLGFVAIALFALRSAKRSEQNQVWVGLSKETAHQLGTPISSLLAWSELLKSKHPDDKLITEMGRDIDRLSIIAERFSKIGSKPDLQPVDLHETLKNAVQYVNKRSSKKVSMKCHFSNKEPIFVELNTQLFDWVIENICKNAIDAMDGVGRIDVNVERKDRDVIIDITDTGKGLDKKQFKAIFTPGYTTKNRGWGLGLSLAKRIVEEYHKGKIFVKQSEINGGTTFRIVLKAKV
jgi:signal transduction histidine kinase